MNVFLPSGSHMPPQNGCPFLEGLGHCFDVSQIPLLQMSLLVIPGSLCVISSLALTNDLSFESHCIPLPILVVRALYGQVWQGGRDIPSVPTVKLVNPPR